MSSVERPPGVKPGSIVQIDPSLPRFGGCLMVVTEIRSWGAVGYFRIPGSLDHAFYQVEWESVFVTGGAAYWK